jgi:hypothetical protein
VKKFVAVTVVVAIAIAIWLLLRGSNSNDAQAHGSGNDTTSMTGARAPSLPTESSLGSATPSDPALQGALMDAMRQLQMDTMPAFDGCIGPTKSPRKPLAMKLRFDRVAEDRTALRYRAGDVVVHDEVRPDVRACLDRIRGREITLPQHSPTGDGPLFTSLTLFVPTTDTTGAN